ncbi:uncharacterized protein LOC143912054 [Arctopsyche grandis]|uniref:uncharacterized protein LOC143912054 n=1 Tax=Arctopsyche grandis TaxID=121162 RepID=UPI00406D88DB
MSAEVKQDAIEVEAAVMAETEEETVKAKNGDAENGGNETGIDDALNTTQDSDPGKSKKVHPGGKTMIVKNLPASMLFTYEEELRNIFGKYGQIKYIKRGGIPIYIDTVEPTLSAYVNFENSESSEQALAERGTILGGNPIEIDILRAGEHTVVICNLPYVIAKECLYKLLSPCGAIKDIVKIPARPTAFVEFEDEEGAKKALSLSGRLLINNIQVVLQRRGGPDVPLKKVKKNVPTKRGTSGGIKRGNRGGGMGRGGARNPPMGGGGGGGGGYNSWEGGQQLGYRGPPRGNNYGNNGGGMSYNNNWGNGGNYRDNNMDERPFKRRKQNDWLWY